MDRDYSNVRVYAKHLQSSSVIHQACIGDWTRHHNDTISPGEESDYFDVVLGKGAHLALCRFSGDEADAGRPIGSLEQIHEQPVFGTIKDMATLFCNFEDEDEESLNTTMHTDQHNTNIPQLGYLPKLASPTILVITSDSGFLSFLTFHHPGDTRSTEVQGRFYLLKEIEIAEPGFDYSHVGARIAIDPTNRIMAVAALQNHIKLVILRSTTRANFDPVERISQVELKGTIIGMEFLTPEADDEDDNAILAVLFYQYEEKVTLVTVERIRGPGTTKTTKHTHRSSLGLLKRETAGHLSGSSPGFSSGNPFPLISACATPPRSPHPTSDQTVYLGSDTSELYRINVNHLTYSMQFELVSGERPVGNVMLVLGRRQVLAEPTTAREEQEIILNTDYVLYSSDQGDGGILAIKEEEDGGIELFAITELQNSSPVLDFCAQEPALPGHDSLYICSGLKQEGSLKRVRSGIPAESSGSGGNQFFAGATGLWNVKENRDDAFDSFLVVSFVQSTTLMKTGDGGSLEDISMGCGLDLTQATVSAGRLNDGTIFQAHRNGVIAVDPRRGTRFTWSCTEGVITTAYWAKENTLILGQISSGASSLLVLQLLLSGDVHGLQPQEHQFKVVSSKQLNAEPTAIHCWQTKSAFMETDQASEQQLEVFCCVGTLEPAVIVYQLNQDGLWDLYNESLGMMVLRMLIVSQACSFEAGEGDQVSRPSYIFIVDHYDMQLVTLDEMRKYNYQTMALGHTPRRILDITSKRLLLIACVGDGFPFAPSTLLLIDPQRASSEPGLETQHIVAEFSLKQGEAVYCLVEWRIPRPNKSDAVYICVGTGLFSPTGSEVSAATPKTGRLVVLSVKQSKKADRKARKFEMDLRWAMAMPAPVFAICPYMNMRLLISNGPVLKLLALDLERKTLVERASHRERWPIVQISSQGAMICTGSRRESLCFYEYQAGVDGGRSFDKLTFLKSARASRIVSDCIAISPEFAVGVDMSGGIFGLGYSRNNPNCQHSLVDRFSFHMGEVVNKIRLAKVWPADERSLAGISLSQQQLVQDHGTRTARTWTSSQLLGQGSSSNSHGSEPTPPSSGTLASLILLPWTACDNATFSALAPAPSQSTQSQAFANVSSQALIACTLTGSILGFWRLRPEVCQILSSLQSTLQDSYECRPVAGNAHGHYRSLLAPALHTIDGDLLNQFLQLEHVQQVQLLRKGLGIDRMVEAWVQESGMSDEERSWMGSHGTGAWSTRRVLSGGCAVHAHMGQDHGWCRAAGFIGHIICYLQSLDWHQ
ncbi:hypothetical protein EC968_006173 [Mortierella alpina]|nr:hypothetical protein EC968_006173 [Mortierella alpina]